MERLLIAYRALGTVSQPYALLPNNCEHTATFAESGVPQSPTVGVILITLALGTVAYLTLRSSSR